MSIEAQETTNEAEAAERDRVRVEITDHVAEVVLDRPEKHNALDPAMFEAIGAAGTASRLSPRCGPCCFAATGRASAPASTSPAS